MAFRKKKRSSGGGGGNKGMIRGHLGGFMALIFGCVALLIALITYTIALNQLDTAYTAAATYTEQVGLSDVMGVIPMLLFLVFLTVGLGFISGGAIVQGIKAWRGDWTEVFMGIVMGTVGIVISVIMNGIIQSQLHNVYVTANALTNIANFAGLLDIMTIFGMVIFIVLITSGIGQILASGWGAFKNIRSAI